MASKPWSNWIPGVLSPNQIRQLVTARHLLDVNFEKSPPEGSAFDLHITKDAWRLDGGSLKPSRSTYYDEFLQDLGTPQFPNSEGVFSLEQKKTYVFRVSERLQGLAESGIYGQATAKSSVGRMDVLVRLIVDGTDGYEGFTPTKSLGGTMYVEVTPMTFPVRVRVGHSLSQLRLFYGRPDQCVIRGKELAKTIGTRDEHEDWLHVDLSPVKIGGHETVAFCAKKQDKIKTIDLWKGDGARRRDPCDFWTFCSPNPQGRLKLKEDSFYILRSKERLALPGGVAAYCSAIDETVGEMRIHYAGFVHPWFGRNRPDNQIGTPLIFEVRGHDLSVNLRDDEVLARVTIYRMSEDIAEKDKPKPTSYDKQELLLSGFFDDWPKSLEQDSDGNVSLG